MLEFGKDTEVVDEIELEDLGESSKGIMMPRSFNFDDEEEELLEFGTDSGVSGFGADEFEEDLGLEEIGDIGDDLDDLLSNRVILPIASRDTFNGQYSVDLLGLNPLTVVKEHDLDVVSTLLNLYKKERVEKFVREMKAFANHIAVLINKNIDFQTQDYVDVYNMVMIRANEFATVSKNLQYLSSTEELTDRTLRNIFQTASMGDKFDEVKLNYVIKSLEMAEDNPLLDLRKPESKLWISMSEYLSRNYTYTDKERKIFEDLDFPDIFENESIIKSMANVIVRIEESEIGEKKVAETGQGSVLSHLKYPSYFYNCKVANDNKLVARTYKIG